MANEQAEILKLDASDIPEQAREILDRIAKIHPDEVHCMLGIIVSKGPPRDDTPEGHINCNVSGFVLGDDNDIAKMFTTLVTITRNGIAQANTPADETEVRH